MGHLNFRVLNKKHEQQFVQKPQLAIRVKKRVDNKAQYCVIFL